MGIFDDEAVLQPADDMLRCASDRIFDFVMSRLRFSDFKGFHEVILVMGLCHFFPESPMALFDIYDLPPPSSQKEPSDQSADQQ